MGSVYGNTADIIPDWRDVCSTTDISKLSAIVENENLTTEDNVCYAH